MQIYLFLSFFFFLLIFVLFMICQQEYFVASKPWAELKDGYIYLQICTETHTHMRAPPPPQSSVSPNPDTYMAFPKGVLCVV